MPRRRLRGRPTSYPERPFAPQPLYLPLDDPGYHEPLAPARPDQEHPAGKPSRVIIIELG